jgi:RNA polymerase sigma-70 factor (ECF subfamily)
MDDRSGRLLARWRQGDQDAAAELFQRYADRLMELARKRLPRKLAPRVDPEDVVQSVYRSFFTAARDGRFAVNHGGDLWRLLVTITLNKLYHQVERHQRGRRDVSREQQIGGDDSWLRVHAHLLTRQPSAEEAAVLADELQTLMQRLDPLPRRLLELRLQGHNLDEIATELDCSERTVIRMLQRIQQQLRAADPPE